MPEFLRGIRENAFFKKAMSVLFFRVGVREVGEKAEVLSGVADGPGWLFFTATAPLLILSLLLFNGHHYIRSEMDAANLRAFWSFQGLVFLDMAALTGAWLFHAGRRRRLGVPFFIIMLFAQAGLVAALLVLLGGICPSRVNLFIFDPGLYMCYVFTFLMPSMFHPIIGMSLGVKFTNLLRHLAWTFFGVVGIPLGLYWFVVCVWPFLEKIQWFRRLLSSDKFYLGQVFGIIGFLLFLMVAAIFMIMVVRFLVATYMLLERRGASWWTIPLLAALVFPLGGLLLNVKIPFPTDFQDWRVYALTVLNALFLLLPPARRGFLDAALFFCRGACYVFTLYFFLVFLPYLPLFLPAILAAGAGFLILAPTILFYVHTRRLAEDFKRLAAWAGRWRTAALFAVSLTVLPGFVVFNAVSDRNLVDAALDKIYASDYDAPCVTPGEAEKLGRLLRKLHDYKQGVSAPYLDSFYQWVAFDDMVLSDSKIKDAYFKVSGENLHSTENRMGFRAFRGQGVPGDTARRLSPENMSWRNTGVRYEAAAGGTVRAVLSFSVKNTGGNPDREAIMDVVAPDWVLVSGLSLKMDREFVTGRLFEKKSAIWIYEKIRNERRDPALLYYVSGNRMRLHIFPFNAGEERFATLELVYPSGLSPEIVADGVRTRLSGPDGAKAAARAGFMVVDPASDKSLPDAGRRPVLRFIVDSSRESVRRMPPLKDIVGRVSAQTGVREFSIAAATVSTETLCEGPDAGSKDLRTPPLKPLPGGFMAERAVKAEALRWSGDRERFPVFVLVSAGGMFNLSKCDFAGFEGLLPETGAVFFTDVGDGRLRRLDLEEKKEEDFQSLKIRPVVLHPELGVIRKDLVRVVPREPGGSCAYSKGLFWRDENVRLARKPSLARELFPRVVLGGKECGIMNSATSYIVLERDSQWRKLEAAEKKRLGANRELDLEKTPEPDVLILAGLAVAAALLSGRFFRRRVGGPVEAGPKTGV